MAMTAAGVTGAGGRTVFVVRVAGNFVNEDGLASLEFGAAVLQSPLILVLGHTNCGAISSTIGSPYTVRGATCLPGFERSAARTSRV